jgi:hypothetical protein
MRLVTLKPTRGRVSTGPLIGATNSVGHAWIEEFVLTRTVRDTAAALPLLSGRRPGDPFAPTPALRPTGSGERLRIGITTTPFMEIPWHETDPACVRAATETATLLSELGHTVVPVDPPRYDMAAHHWRYGMSGPAPTMVARDLDAVADIIGRPFTPGDVGPVIWTGRTGPLLHRPAGPGVRRVRAPGLRHRRPVVGAGEPRSAAHPHPGPADPAHTEYLPPPAGTYAVSLDDPTSIGLALLALFPLVGFTQLFYWTGQPACHRAGDRPPVGPAGSRSARGHRTAFR